MEPQSVIDGLGEEIVSIVTPVSICMFVVVCLVHGLTPHGSDSGASPFIATSFYHEKSTDSAEAKLGGALLNALVFIVAVAAVTFILVALFYFRCMKVIWGYMGFSGFTILGLLGGLLGIQIIQAASIPLDIITFSILLWNFSVVGVLAVFFWKMPIFLKQGYLVFIGAVVAFWFTKLPEWTTWTVLAAMALYDLVAVLAPGGPLKLLVEMSIERDEDIPALIYEARPTSLSRGEALMSRRPHQDADAAASDARGRRRRHHPGQEGQDGVEQLVVAPSSSEPLHSSEPPNSLAAQAHEAPVEIEIDSERRSRTPPGQNGNLSRGQSRQSEEDGHLETERQPLVGGTEHRGSSEAAEGGREEGSGEHGLGFDEEEWGLPDAIKLGLGDFIFYSLLVGRAAMYDLMTVYACYLAIVAGLGATLVLLAVYRHALPALPISIALGIVFYFFTRTIMEPFAVGLSTNLLYF